MFKRKKINNYETSISMESLYDNEISIIDCYHYIEVASTKKKKFYTLATSTCILGTIITLSFEVTAGFSIIPIVFAVPSIKGLCKIYLKSCVDEYIPINTNKMLSDDLKILRNFLLLTNKFSVLIKANIAYDDIIRLINDSFINGTINKDQKQDYYTALAYAYKKLYPLNNQNNSSYLSSISEMKNR